ncbi:protein-methionine-sulfoxide reductase catalytic subunit MsrP [Roseateles microcysteis]|uniref:protein-methionine-sulfoxide reductase catalytic subunit MsrP n=1 Tax=Roseateles microcysteis TaxID=3119057 RepID=UPI002FE5C498
MHFLPDRGLGRLPESEVTPRSLYASRRELLALGAAATLLPNLAQAQAGAKLAAIKSAVPGAMVLDKPTRMEDATRYNNYYEFGTDKSEPARNAHTLKTSPWSVLVEGECAKPGRFDLEALLKLSPMEERIYRLRCVEGWSMVIPWIGYSMAELIRKVEPNSRAKFVEFTTLADKSQMPELSNGALDWPYVEGLRIDEAMHPLTLLAFGMYGEVLPKQNGAPLRLVVPWKYGFKSAKSIIKIRLVEKQPTSSWTKAARQEYGFYSNVNPLVDHPRWSQATERRIGEDGLFAKKRPTLMFNGYEPQVGQLYAGLDLKKNY